MEIIDQPQGSANVKSLDTVLQSGFEFKLGDYIGSGFRMFGNDAGMYILAFLLFIIASFLIGLVPVVGNLAMNLVISPALVAGFYLYARRHQKNLDKSFNNFFDGFNGQTLPQLILQQLVTSLIVGAIVFAVVAPFFFSSFIELLANAGDLENMNDEAAEEFVMSLFTGGLLWGILLASLLAVAVSVIYLYAPMFIVFRGMGFWEAMESSRKVVMKKFMSFFLFMIVLGLLNVVGVLLCCVGLLVSLPVTLLAIYLSFDDIMGVSAD